MINVIGYWVGVTLFVIPPLYLSYLVGILALAILLIPVVNADEGIADKIYDVCCKFVPDDGCDASIIGIASLVISGLSYGVTRQEFFDKGDTPAYIEVVSAFGEWSSSFFGWVVVIVVGYALYYKGAYWLVTLGVKAKELKSKLDSHVKDKGAHK